MSTPISHVSPPISLGLSCRASASLVKGVTWRDPQSPKAPDQSTQPTTTVLRTSFTAQTRITYTLDLLTSLFPLATRTLLGVSWHRYSEQASLLVTHPRKRSHEICWQSNLLTATSQWQAAVLPDRWVKVAPGSLDAGALAVLEFHLVRFFSVQLKSKLY